jgi:hypothetical protein
MSATALVNYAEPGLRQGVLQYSFCLMLGVLYVKSPLIGVRYPLKLSGVT